MESAEYIEIATKLEKGERFEVGDWLWCTWTESKIIMQNLHNGARLRLPNIGGFRPVADRAVIDTSCVVIALDGYVIVADPTAFRVFEAETCIVHCDNGFCRDFRKDWTAGKPHIIEVLNGGQKSVVFDDKTNVVDNCIMRVAFTSNREKEPETTILNGYEVPADFERKLNSYLDKYAIVGVRAAELHRLAMEEKNAGKVDYFDCPVYEHPFNRRITKEGIKSESYYHSPYEQYAIGFAAIRRRGPMSSTPSENGEGTGSEQNSKPDAEQAAERDGNVDDEVRAADLSSGGLFAWTDETLPKWMYANGFATSEYAVTYRSLISSPVAPYGKDSCGFCLLCDWPLADEYVTVDHFVISDGYGNICVSSSKTPRKIAINEWPKHCPLDFTGRDRGHLNGWSYDHENKRLRLCASK